MDLVILFPTRYSMVLPSQHYLLLPVLMLFRYKCRVWLKQCVRSSLFERRFRQISILRVTSRRGTVGCYDTLAEHYGERIRCFTLTHKCIEENTIFQFFVGLMPGASATKAEESSSSEFTESETEETDARNFDEKGYMEFFTKNIYYLISILTALMLIGSTYICNRPILCTENRLKS
jgi:hypothetical protein